VLGVIDVGWIGAQSTMGSAARCGLPGGLLLTSLTNPTTSVRITDPTDPPQGGAWEEAYVGVVDDVLANNERYAASFGGPLPMPPALRVAVLACMDARLNVYAMLGLAEGQAHVIRNAGGVATDDAIRSLVISQRLLGTREVILIHHTDCGMLTFHDDEVKEQIRADTGIRPPFSLEAFPDPDDDVRQSVARLESSPFIPHKDAIRGFVFEVETGRLREVR
jgi:carbonic anhydrase